MTKEEIKEMTPKEFTKRRNDLIAKIQSLYYYGSVSRHDGELWYDTGDEEIPVIDIYSRVTEFIKNEEVINQKEKERQELILERIRLEDFFLAHSLGKRNG